MKTTTKGTQMKPQAVLVLIGVILALVVNSIIQRYEFNTLKYDIGQKQNQFQDTITGQINEPWKVNVPADNYGCISWSGAPCQVEPTFTFKNAADLETEISGLKDRIDNLASISGYTYIEASTQTTTGHYDKTPPVVAWTTGIGVISIGSDKSK